MTQRLNKIWRTFWAQYWHDLNAIQRVRVLGTIGASLTIGAGSLALYVLAQWVFADAVPTWDEIKAAAATGVMSGGAGYQMFPKYMRMRAAQSQQLQQQTEEVTDAQPEN